MSLREAARVEVLALALTPLVREEDRLQVRAVLQGPGLSAAVTTWIGTDEVESLLSQVEGQHEDLTRRVAWETRATPTLRLLWRVGSRGQLDGKAEVRDRAEGWAASARVRGDQSYLPRLALGLRHLLR